MQLSLVKMKSCGMRVALTSMSGVLRRRQEDTHRRPGEGSKYYSFICSLVQRKPRRRLDRDLGQHQRCREPSSPFRALRQFLRSSLHLPDLAFLQLPPLSNRMEGKEHTPAKPPLQCHPGAQLPDPGQECFFTRKPEQFI